MVKDKIAEGTAARKLLAQHMPDPSGVFVGSLMSRMVRCNKPGCRYCEKGARKGHGPIWILSVRLDGGRVRQIPVPKQLKSEVEQGLQTFAQIQQVLKQIGRVNQELLEERKRRR